MHAHLSRLPGGVSPVLRSTLSKPVLVRPSILSPLSTDSVHHKRFPRSLSEGRGSCGKL